ncbi:MAG: multidrug transporter AcrB [Flavobacteriaceae bacterium CG2_30_34_30]|nr:CusA/CzcA family heavy metal efflux RND transporter [Flavobacteriia bacterium]OIP49863.1 MAG: multidrug transporter AcrB [Flavobacteriaceae bacterium CG2_30_34_30]PIQ18841.1 MAG: CusA/CzcA family heavy metal efflux RND transporter [Flavobacteriaceae bacterium CG18_big_fil_WC_8_21_14_2_50_34_36]PIV50977.1 MAG: CusA/CzcA family heavy metal efflux RND transporter [Flavobacteriaceae bacterium CG02_land_8_20_14_3_00_34_13]PIZ07435.1 MAG: CusA/CzcA family heavy metal efflux RND transporter [Flavob
MLEKIIQYSIHHKLIVLLFTLGIVGFGIYSLLNIPIGAVPDITNNQVQVITTSRNLATQDVEKFLTYPVELEMANLPGVIEIRSVSKFGLSVVTIVFEDKMGTYLPRQLIAEKLKSAEEKIPAAFGIPFMGPISTGLGEIYQYTLEVDENHKGNYSIMELRTIQDWVVKRQLSGIPGVVEVNTWGGHLKQYEVAVNPERLRSLNISLSDLFKAIEKNNSVAGGGYIEKTNESFFIRGEGLVSSLEDIENIVVENRDGIPIYVKDLANVGFGKANRFGAITGNGEGEKVLGQIMMLKNANSKAVIDAVKLRVSEIQSSLPEGIYINGFLERSELIGKTTFTIAENLLLGCLIVIFVVVLLLGNIRSGLVVASVIPLSLLFALSLMYIFNVDANLMSLGAIDFGIIIDGAVIIVEFIAFKITSERSHILALPNEERQNLINKITFQGATKMMRSAVFGQLIIIIVFIPILSLINVEGKMFQPMALVFCFALIGAMLMCFTYVPVVASMFLKPTDKSKKTISSRLIHFLEKKYKPTIIWALRKKQLVLGLAISLLVVVAYLFTTMGGEFVPTLDEGDFVIQPVLKTGTSLTKTIETTTRIEKILKTFPEVDQVISRIGAAEVPTDPMSMEESDVIIKLKPKTEWVSALNKDELAEKFKSALSEIPGIEYEFTQPIEMRFNELITGVRADLAIKIFGENLDILYKKGLEIQKAIQNVEGAADIIVEKVAGLPQMSVQYDRKKIAKYGLNMADLNSILTTGFAGKSAGIVFEGEKQFDLVIRYDENNRKDIDNIETASVVLPNGNTFPLSEFATISYSKGPAKISRDDTKRRIVVGVNVRNRDLESVVKDVQKIIERDIILPTGYTITYGGQFQNLRSAKERLAIAVPIALVLIFVLLYFAFNSVKEALIIYSAIPMAAIGGVLLLFLRGLPFSISAGVGFIALFGIAVLNGIVLIEHFKELKTQGIHDINKRIIMGTRDRLRPVLLTAAAAALGFLPMAISTSVGAEVQRPLATVVVGGLISATALTLIVLPVLYAMFDRKGHFPKPKLKKNVLLLLLFFISIPWMGNAQEKNITVEEAIEIALKNNKSLRTSFSKVQQNKNLVMSAFNIDKTQMYYNFDENNIAENGQPIKVIGISQTFQFPSIYRTQHKIQKYKVGLSEKQYTLDSKLLTKQVSKAYIQIVYWQQVIKNFVYLDSLYSKFAYAANRRFEMGETNYLEKLTAASKQKEIEILLKQGLENVAKSYLEFQGLLQTEQSFVVPDQALEKWFLQPVNIKNNEGIQYYQQAQNLSKAALSLEKQTLLPDIQVSLFQGTNSYENARVYKGFQVGLAFPLWFGNHRAKIKAAKTEIEIVQNEFENYKTKLEIHYQILLTDISKYEEGIFYFENQGKILAKELFLNAEKAFNQGEINYLQYVQLLENAKTIELNYLENLLQYNFTVLDIKYLIN